MTEAQALVRRMAVRLRRRGEGAPDCDIDVFEQTTQGATVGWILNVRENHRHYATLNARRKTPHAKQHEEHEEP